MAVPFPRSCAGVITEPRALCLDDRGKCAFSVTFEDAGHVAAVSSARVLLVVTGAGGLVPVASTPVVVVANSEADPVPPTTPWMGVNCRMFGMPSGLPPIVLLESLGALLLLHLTSIAPGRCLGLFVHQCASRLVTGHAMNPAY